MNNNNTNENPLTYVNGFSFGGGEGNRTPVRKHIHLAFYGCSLFQDLTPAVKTNKSRKSQSFNS